MSKKLNKQLSKAAWFGNFDDFKNALNNGADARYNENEPLRCAASNGHLDIVQYLFNYHLNISDLEILQDEGCQKNVWDWICEYKVIKNQSKNLKIKNKNNIQKKYVL